MNRVYLVASANMEAKVKEVMDAVAAAGLIAAAYKPCVNGAEAAKELKAHNSAVLMEKIKPPRNSRPTIPPYSWKRLPPTSSRRTLIPSTPS